MLRHIQALSPDFNSFQEPIHVRDFSKSVQKMHANTILKYSTKFDS